MNDAGREVLWEGDGWRITTTGLITSPPDMRVMAVHVGCKMQVTTEYEGESWMIDDELYEDLEYQACYGCHERVPDSVITLMTLYIGGM